jgi:hypothetical protein
MLSFCSPTVQLKPSLLRLFADVEDVTLPLFCDPT